MLPCECKSFLRISYITKSIAIYIEQETRLLYHFLKKKVQMNIKRATWKQYKTSFLSVVHKNFLTEYVISCYPCRNKILIPRTILRRWSGCRTNVRWRTCERSSTWRSNTSGCETRPLQLSVLCCT